MRYSCCYILKKLVEAFKKMKKERDNIFWIISLLLGCIVLSVVIVGVWYYQVWESQNHKNSTEAKKSYKYHCAFISEDSEDPFGKSVFEGAKEAGEEMGIYVEYFGENLSLNYDEDELLEIAIASKVDAIILKGAGRSSTEKLINEAMETGIAVVTVSEDDMKSKRCSFIGINKFRMGYDLCAQAVEQREKENGNIMVMFDQVADSPDNTIVLSGMKKYLDENSGNYTLDTQVIDSRESYNVEEQVRMLLRDASKRPDIVICTSLAQTQCVYQTLVDLNIVGDVEVVGFYYTEPILEAIEKGIIQTTYVIDAPEMGRQAVNSVSEYKEFGYVSDYVSVEATIVNKNTAKSLIKEEDAIEEGTP